MPKQENSTAKKLDAKFMMFSYAEKKDKWDEYGQSNLTDNLIPPVKRSRTNHQQKDEKLFIRPIKENYDTISSDHQLILSPNLLSTLNFKKSSDTNICWIDARLDATKKSGQLSLEILPKKRIPYHKSIVLNDPKLSELQISLNKAGFSTKMISGALFVNNIVRVIKNSSGKFEIEGVVSEEYYRIRDTLYSNFAIL